MKDIFSFIQFYKGGGGAINDDRTADIAPKCKMHVCELKKCQNNKFN